MRKKQVWRFYCDHCKKSGGSGGHIAKHERGCTANPNRTCGVCYKLTLDSKPLPELIAFVRTHAKAGESIDGNPDDSSLWLGEDAIKQLRELAGNCPCCMLAAARQSNVYLSYQGFDFKSELKSLWSDHNDEQEIRGARFYG